MPKTHKKENSQTAKSEIVWGVYRENAASMGIYSHYGVPVRTEH